MCIQESNPAWSGELDWTDAGLRLPAPPSGEPVAMETVLTLSGSFFLFR